jgi:hypothetical protein
MNGVRFAGTGYYTRLDRARFGRLVSISARVVFMDDVSLRNLLVERFWSGTRSKKKARPSHGAYGPRLRNAFYEFARTIPANPGNVSAP